MKRVFVLVALVLLASIYAGLSGETEYRCENCNIVVISVEPVRQDHVGFYGYERNTTPNLDKLAKNSLVFEKAFSQSPHTFSSTISTFTSMYPSEHKLWAYNGRNLTEHMTFEEVLKNNGYYTQAVVEPNTGFDRGRGKYFDEVSNISRSTFDHNISSIVDSLESKDRFFLYYQGFAGHIPHMAPSDRYSKMFNGTNREFRNKTFEEWDKTFSNNSLGKNEKWKRITDFYLSRVKGNDTLRRHAISEYDGEIRYVDHRIGDLLNEMERRNMKENTVIVFTSAHGELFGEHGKWSHTTLWNEVINVPLAIRIPGTENKEVDEYVELIDLVPTLLDIVDIENNEFQNQSSGISMIQIIKGEAKENPVISQYSTKDQISFIEPSHNLKYYNSNNFEYVFNLTSDFEEAESLENEDLKKELRHNYESTLNSELEGTKDIWPYIAGG